MHSHDPPKCFFLRNQPVQPLVISFYNDMLAQVITATTDSAVRPFPKGSTEGSGGTGRWAASHMACGFVPTKLFHPSSRVSTDSGSSRKVTQGTRSQYGSFGTPTESVKI